MRSIDPPQNHPPADRRISGLRKRSEMASTKVSDQLQRGPRVARLIPKYAKPPATTRLSQLSHIGTAQPPITAGQPM
jgi:hypothetical protein